MSEVGLQSPWVTFVEEVKELFKNDPEVHVEYDGQYDGQYELKLFVDNDDKYDALTKILPSVKVFGNVVLNITLVPANAEGAEEEDLGELFEKAFAGNPALAFVAKQEDPAVGPVATYVVFKKEVVQFYNDDLSDYFRNKNTLYQDIAGNVFGRDLGVCFCTDDPSKHVDAVEEAEEVEEDSFDDEEDKEFGADE